MDRNSKIAASLSIALFGALAMLDASKLPPPRSGGGLGPGFLPLWVGAGVLLLAIGQLVAALREPGVIGDKSAWPGRESILRVGYMLLALAVYVFLSDVIGFLLSTWLYLAVGMKLLAPYRWWAIVAGSLVASIATTAIFRMWLTMPLPTGFVGL